MKFFSCSLLLSQIKISPQVTQLPDSVTPREGAIARDTGVLPVLSVPRLHRLVPRLHSRLGPFLVQQVLAGYTTSRPTTKKIPTGPAIVNRQKSKIVSLGQRRRPITCPGLSCIERGVSGQRRSFRKEKPSHFLAWTSTFARHSTPHFGFPLAIIPHTSLASLCFTATTSTSKRCTSLCRLYINSNHRHSRNIRFESKLHSPLPAWVSTSAPFFDSATVSILGFSNFTRRARPHKSHIVHALTHTLA